MFFSALLHLLEKRYFSMINARTMNECLNDARAKRKKIERLNLKMRKGANEQSRKRKIQKIILKLL